jgi:uncharacterized protein YaaN involved in tellurite resistance
VHENNIKRSIAYYSSKYQDAKENINRIIDKDTKLGFPKVMITRSKEMIDAFTMIEYYKTLLQYIKANNYVPNDRKKSEIKKYARESVLWSLQVYPIDVI